jgi:hypothetical protein
MENNNSGDITALRVLPTLTEPTRNRLLIGLLTIVFAICTLFDIYLLYKFWPNSQHKTLLFGRDMTNISIEQQYFFLIILGGALGALLHVVISFTAFVGNRSFITSWLPWYCLRPFVGAGMALIFYLLLRGGLMTYSPSQNTPPAKATSTSRPAPATDTVKNKKAVPLPTIDSSKTTVAEKNTQNQQVPLNPFGMLAVACLAGLFSKQASKKLEEIFNTVFNIQPASKVLYTDKLATDPKVQVMPSNGDQQGTAAKGSNADINDVLPDADPQETPDNSKPKG